MRLVGSGAALPDGTALDQIHEESPSKNFTRETFLINGISDK
jgi:hypothetical protein